jgi:uncharacterized coiled-coil protein SlyX
MTNWLKSNQGLVIALAGQALLAGIYFVNLEARVSTLETRGSPHLQEINTRLTTLEKLTEANKDSLERMKDVMTRRLNINP